MKNEIFAVGNLKERYLKEGIDEYRKRLSVHLPLAVREFREYALPSDPSEALIQRGKEEEGKAMLAAIDDETIVVACDLAGRQLTSPQLAENLGRWQSSGKRRLVFVIGGSYGLSEELLNRADFRISFGLMTFPHQLMRLILVEQLYRGVKINRGETYHK